MVTPNPLTTEELRRELDKSLNPVRASQARLETSQARLEAYVRGIMSHLLPPAKIRGD